MIEAELADSVGKLWRWLSTWLHDDGGLHGYIVHHHRDCFRVLAPDTWTQAPSILGLVALYEKTKDDEWLNTAKALSDFLVRNYIGDLHIFYNSNHEKKPLGRPNLIGNALPSYALLKFALARKLRGEEWQRYYQISRDNILNFILPLWDRHVKAFYGWPDSSQHIHNMNSVAIMALIALSTTENNKSYIDNFAVPAASYITQCQVKVGRLVGAYPYADKKEDYIALYTLITALGLLHLHSVTGDKKYLDSVVLAMRHLINLFDRETFLVSHYPKMRFPQWIPDTLLFAMIVKRLKKESISFDVDVKGILRNLLRRQYTNGAFPLSVGFARRGLRKSRPMPNKSTLRDALPTPNWNSWNFWALCKLLPAKCSLDEPKIEFPLIIQTDMYEKGSYRVIEDLHLVKIMGNNNELVALFNKKKDMCEFCLLEEEDLASMMLKKINALPWVIRTPLTFFLRRT